MNVQDIVLRYKTGKYHTDAQREKRWFERQPTLEAAITYAAIARDERGKMYDHQHKIRTEALSQALAVLLAHKQSIEHAKDFDDLFALIDRILRPLYGIKEMYIYDTALRLGFYLRLLPSKVYLHRGTREGARILGLDWTAQTLSLSDFHTNLRENLQELEPYEIEDLFCLVDNLHRNGEKIDLSH